MRRDSSGRPLDQPIAGCCGKCHRWTIYVVIPRQRQTSIGEIVEPVAVRGGTLAMMPDGRVNVNRDPQRWGTNRHRCRARF